MRSRAVLLSLLTFAVIAAGLAVPAQASPPTKFEGKIAHPAPIGDAMSGAEWDEILCPDAGPSDGSFYKFIDLKGEYKNLKAEGPTPLFTDPTGTTAIGSYDLDLYVFDAKCNDLNHSNTSGGLERFDSKKGARYVVIHYYNGVHADLPYKLQASNGRIK